MTRARHQSQHPSLRPPLASIPRETAANAAPRRVGTTEPGSWVERDGEARSAQACSCGRPAVVDLDGVPWCGTSNLPPLPGSPQALAMAAEGTWP